MDGVSEIVWEEGWMDEILDQADREVRGWPAWMQRQEYRHPSGMAWEERRRLSGIPNGGDGGLDD